MEMFAIIFGIICLIFGFLLLVDSHEFNKNAVYCILVAILFQFLWFPQVFDTRIDTKTQITNKHENYVFERPVKITKTRTYKPLSAITDYTVYTVEFIKGE